MSTRSGQLAMTSASDGSMRLTGHPTSRACDSRTAKTSSGFMVTQGTPGFMIPAFSRAIFWMVSPRNSVCSIPMLLMTATSGVMTLVLSNLPPIPTSMTAMSADTREKYFSAMTVRTSKLVHSLPSDAMASTWGLTSPMSCSRSASDMSSPSMRMLSLTFIMCGDVKAPTRIPDALRMDSTMAHTDPLPSVPATWMYRIPSRGSPTRLRSSSVFSRPGLTPLLASPSNHSMFPSGSKMISAPAHMRHSLKPIGVSTGYERGVRVQRLSPRPQVL